jgi:hypothetical protein
MLAGNSNESVESTTMALGRNLTTQRDLVGCDVDGHRLVLDSWRCRPGSS